ncbi:MAG: DUF4382 domain-containing protein, partial [Deltaproteobacteria bacterium]|nr:DUF4382 domain-containing protein [Deltaproteobacteria bacterium]
PSAQYNAVYVTIEAIQVLRDGTPAKWETISTPMKTLNLLELVNGISEKLGLSKMAPGTFARLRLVLGTKPDGSVNMLQEGHPFANYIIDLKNKYHELNLPPRVQDGINIIRNFTVTSERLTELMLDLDAHRSIVLAGGDHFWFEPVANLFIGDHFSTIAGTVIDVSSGIPLAGATIQAFSDQEIGGETRTDSGGSYKIYVSPGEYQLKAATKNYAASSGTVSLSPSEMLIQNFILSN